MRLVTERTKESCLMTCRQSETVPATPAQGYRIGRPGGSMADESFQKGLKKEILDRSDGGVRFLWFQGGTLATSHPGEVPSGADATQKG